MPVSFRCPHCQSKLKVKSDFSGRTIRCPQDACGQKIKVPAVKKKPKPADDVDPWDSLDWEDPASKKSASNPSRKSSASAKRTKGKKAAKSGGSKLVPVLVIGGLLLAAGAWQTFSGSTAETSVITAMTEPAVVQAKEQPTKPAFTDHVTPFMQQYCYDCHSGGEGDAGINLDQFSDWNQVLENRKVWERILKQVRVGAMPPSDTDQPGDQERTDVVAHLHDTLYSIDCVTQSRPGRNTIRRLNRVEYNNTVNDLLGINVNLSKDFPADDVGYGFDTIGDVLTISPLHMERYLSAAEKATQAAIVLPSVAKLDQSYTASSFKTEGSVRARRSQMLFFSFGTIHKTLDVSLAGKYKLIIKATANQAGNENAKMLLRVNKKEIKVFEVDKSDGRRASPNTRTVDVDLKAGSNAIAITFVNDFYDENAKDKNRKDRNLIVHSFKVEGPKNFDASSMPESHKQLITKTPNKDASDIREVAFDILSPFMTRAFRRPVQNGEVVPYVDLVETIAKEDYEFEKGIQLAVQAVMVSPEFLYRKEGDTSQGQKSALSNHELASRLSYFLWSTMPDQKLFDLAQRGDLSKRHILREQVQRMLRDPKAKEFVANFAGQWLGLRKLNETEPDEELFKEYDDQLKQAMWKETELFFGDIIHENRPVLELLDAPYTFVNERLAKLYGIPNVKGNKFQKVSLENTPRRGVLTQASILTITSFPDRTSPVKRGEWILTNILGDEPPPAPPSVPGLEETAKAHPDLPLRKQLEMHRADPGCNSCHKLMDDIGFGFENFDAIGKFRTKEGKYDIDSSGVLPSGESFSGSVELVSILKQRERDFARSLTEKLMTYAIGRGIEWYDKCALDAILNAAEVTGYRSHALIEEIVVSEAFRLRES